LFVPVFLNFFDDLGAEGVKVSWVAGRDDPLVDDDLAILPLGAFATSVLIDL
jgi:hypothetical protein